MPSSNDRLKLRKIIHDIFLSCDNNGDGMLDKKELLDAAKNNTRLK